MQLKLTSQQEAGLRLLLRCGTLLLLGLSAYWAIRLAWADHLSLSSGSTGITDRERAVQLAPAFANLYERLADKREELGGDSLADLHRAVSLDPENAMAHAILSDVLIAPS